MIPNIFWILIGVGILVFLFLVGAAIFDFMHRTADTLWKIGEITEIIVKRRKEKEKERSDL